MKIQGLKCPLCSKQLVTDGCSEDSTDGKRFVRLHLNNTVVALHSINQSITPPNCKMDERKQQPQIDHCFVWTNRMNPVLAERSEQRGLLHPLGTT